tara:strand:+ start:1041 stop:1976 length:936 start_codon:yes stop_codon:yes gene_type:complete
MNFLISLILLFQDKFRGNSGTMDNVPEGMNYWIFKYIIIPFIIFGVIMYIRGMIFPPEYEIKAKKRDLENQQNKKLEKIKNHNEYERLKALNGYYENSDVTTEVYLAEIKIHRIYLNLPEVKNHKSYLDRKGYLDKYLVNGIVNIRNYENKLTQKEYYINGVIDYIVYFDPLFEIQREGLWSEERKNGKVKFEKNLENGKLNGNSKHWFRNGNIKSDKDYKDGKLDGRVGQWFKNGNIKSDFNYKDGELHGNCKEWFKSGEIKDDMNYKDGKLHGLCKFLYEEEDFFLDNGKYIPENSFYMTSEYINGEKV